MKKSYFIDKEACIFVAGHKGLAGSAICRSLAAQGYTNVLIRDREQCDLRCKEAVDRLFAENSIEYVFLAAARVGGIGANIAYPAEFMMENLFIQSHVLHAAMEAKVKRLLFLGSSCIYPAEAKPPIKERAYMTGPLEVTNRPYAVAKMAGIETCWAYNKQHNTQFLAVMPANLYGPNDYYHRENAHVIPALIRKLHEGKACGAPGVSMWGGGYARREFLYVDDLADACLFLMDLPEETFKTLLHRKDPEDPKVEERALDHLIPKVNGSHPIINIGCGKDIIIYELVELLQEMIGYRGTLFYDITQPMGVKQRLLDSSLIYNLGWRPRYSLKEGVKLAYADFRKHYDEGTLRD